MPIEHDGKRPKIDPSARVALLARHKVDRILDEGFED